MTDELPRLLTDLLSAYAVNALAMGRASGALAALETAPGTVDEIAERAGLDRRNTELWLRAMAASGHARHDGGVFTLDEETASVLGPEFPLDMGAVLDTVYAGFAPPIKSATAAMRTGAGVPGSEFLELAAAASPANSRIYRASLVEEWIGAAPELAERLRAGGRIAEIACGGGDAAAVMAEAFPDAEVVGFDPATPEGAHADIPNLRFVRDDAARLPGDGSFDLVVCLDAFHHLPVDEVARQVHAALADGGVFLIAEAALTGDVETDNQDPTSLIAHAAGLMYCLQENLANGGDGSTPSIGLDWVTRALDGAGFSSVATHDSETGYRIFLAAR